MTRTISMVGAAALLACLVAASPVSLQAQEPSATPIDPSAYQSFLANWTPSSKPRCAAIQSEADWAKVFHPAPTMGQTKPFGPPGETWKTSAILVIGRVVDAGETAKIFQLSGVHRDADALVVEYRFQPPPKASSRIKWWLGVTVAKPLPARVRFTENGSLVCALAPAKGVWLRP